MQTLGNIILGAMLATASLGPAPWSAAAHVDARVDGTAAAGVHAVEASAQGRVQARLHPAVFRGTRNGS